MERCTQIKEIGRIAKLLDGNGRRGIVHEIATITTEMQIMKSNQDKIEGNLDKMATAISALARVDSNREAVRKALGKALVNASLIVGIFGTIIALILTNNVPV